MHNWTNENGRGNQRRHGSRKLTHAIQIILDIGQTKQQLNQKGRRVKDPTQVFR